MGTEARLSAWSVTAVNLPEHASNPIHTDEGGRAAGFDGALVAGVTTYAYLTHPAGAGDGDGWGLEWVRRGGAELRLLLPVPDGAALDFLPAGATGRWTIEAQVDGQALASSSLWAGGEPWAARGGEQLAPLDVVLDESWMTYGERAGDDLGLYRTNGIVHPASWPRLANDVFHHQLARGAWIHTRSRIQHLGVGAVGGAAHVETVVFDRFDTRAGERAVADVLITVDGLPAAQIEHEALVALHR